jgi:hypothetical protein
MKFKFYQFFIGLLLVAFSTTTHAQIYVNASVSGGMNDGTSWANAYADLQMALANANPNDQI